MLRWLYEEREEVQRARSRGETIHNRIERLLHVLNIMSAVGAGAFRNTVLGTAKSFSLPKGEFAFGIS